MYADTDGVECVTASFVFGGSTVTRQFEIQVLQYSKSDETLGGPQGCLQYYLNNQGIVRTFNWNDADLLKGIHDPYRYIFSRSHTS